MLETRGAQAFMAVAERRSFTAAARVLGVTTSALSQSVRVLEERLGVPLLVRTSRSVGLTEAGIRLLERVAPAIREMDAAFDEARGSGAVVQGTLKVTIGRLTAPLLLEPILAKLLGENPRLSLEVSVDDRFVDIVAEGFDAGVRLSESIEPDLVAIRLTPSFRLVVGGAPSYFRKHGRPRVPRDLLAHDCIGYRRLSTGTLYAWEFEKRGRQQTVATRGRIVCNDGPLMVTAALSGQGLLYVHEQAVEEHVKRGALELVLEDYAVTLPGFFLYVPRRAQLQPKVRAFVDATRAAFGVVASGGRRSAPRSAARRR
jgi:DNA-binding transcriptional LysR family regulator